MKKLLIIICFVLFTMSAFSQTSVKCVKFPTTEGKNSNYISNRAPLQQLSFIKLPVGAIKAGGWAKKYLELQRDGLTGHLGEISAWLQKKDNAWLSKEGKGNWGWEEVPYWLKGYSCLGYLLDDKKIQAESKIWLEAVFASQQPNGFFGPIHITNKKTQDLWANMIMLFTLQDYYDYSGDKRVITLMTNYFKWEMSLPDNMMLQSYWENSRGGDNLYSIFWLYNITGEKWLLDLAERIHKGTANWRQKDNLPNWHNVNVAQCFREPATWFLLSKDSSNLNATYNDFNLIRNIYGQVPGGMYGSDEDSRPGYIDPRQGTETCGFVEQMASDEMLLSFTGDPMWADHCENVAFNSYPATFMPDFKALRYITSPNQVVSDSKDHSPGIQNDGPFMMMNPFSSRCCQHNHSQGWPYYVKSLWMASNDNGIAAVLYNSCEVKAKVANGNLVTIKETTNYPFEETIRFDINSPKAVSFPLYLRIPAWSNNAKVSINGKPINVKLVPGTYARLERTWKTGDKMELTVPMGITVKTWEKNKNSMSVNYGPLTLSLRIGERYEKMDSKKSAIGDSKWQESADQTTWPSFEIYPTTPWNYGLVLDKAKPELSFTVEHKPWPKDNYPFTLDASPLIFKAKGKIIPEWGLDKYGLCGLLPQSPVTSKEQVQEITLLPMGVCRLRISAFPVIAK
jgi:hypothetical protein